jgi:creatinine amidohydrolase
MDLLKQYTISLENHGFEYVLLLPSHGGNFAPVDSAAAEISRTLEKLDLIPLTDLPGYMSLLNQGLAEFGIEYEESVVHAGATETSMVMAVDEDKVRSENIELGNEAEITYGEVLAHGFSDLTQNGVLGDPRKADPEAGETIFEIIVYEYVENIEKQINSIEP